MSPSQLLLNYALRYPAWIILTMILGFSSAIFNGVSVTLIVPLVLGLIGKENLSLKSGPAFIQQIFFLFHRGDGEPNFTVMVLVVVLLIILKNITNYFNSIVSGYLSRKLIKDFIKAGIKLILEVDLTFFAKTKIGDILNKLGHEAGRSAMAVRIAVSILTTSAMILTFVGILISISWKLTLASTALLLLVAIINQYLIKRAKSFGEILSEKSSRYSTALLEILTGIRLIKSVNSEDYEYQHIEKFIEERERADEQSQAY